jgi:hypothetical protein
MNQLYSSNEGLQPLAPRVDATVSQRSDFTTEIAEPTDDAAIRKLLRESVMPGSVAVSYEREPNYFDGCSILGDDVETPVIRLRETGEVVGLCCRAVRELYVQGKPQRVGYLSQLRVAKDYQGHMLVARGMRFLRERHTPDVTGYIATITEGNREATGVLVQLARRSFPSFEEVTGLNTLALVLRPRRSIHSDITVRSAHTDNLPMIVKFLNEQGSKRQLFPVWKLEHFQSSRTRAFNPNDFLLAFAHDELVGTIGLWDQSSYKQTVVHGYNSTLKYLKPAYDAYLRLRGARSLPAIGERIRHAYASFVCIKENDANVFNTLLTKLYQLASERSHNYLMLGLCEGDPLLEVAKRFPHINYKSKLYAVSFEGKFANQLEGLSYVDIATL